MNTRTVLIGAGGHATVVLDALQSAGETAIVLVDADAAKWGTRCLGCEVVGGDEYVLRIPPGEVTLVNGLGGADRAGIARRAEKFALFSEAGYLFRCVLHAGALVSSHVKLGRGAQVHAGAVIQVGCEIGDNAIVNTRASIDHGCSIGAHAHVAPGAVLCGNVAVGERAFVGAGAVVLPGLSIGAGAVVGAGAMVSRNVRMGAVVVGVPAKESVS